ncbi:hypothetical protein N7478_007300 [Penicillium angulare]|uniref:uncharacterized protein n=1 Tax=Penicillium angulare TaxID=116970 RepID=UPI00254233A6|nr:uncharacterized protein N7478_007300 [Penicillium angulare]KAJ5281928.1 hypothetical protein N7478_007300 [Penicillium angulare]
MPSASVTNGWTFTNVGPLTTTFTPAPTCTNNIYIGTTSPEARLGARVECSTYDASGCTPSGIITATGATTTFDVNWPWQGYYYSPGIYCPSGWNTVGVAARGANKTMSSSGIMSMSMGGEDYEIGAFMLADILDPSETLALCCPSGMKGDWGMGACWSAMPNYTPTSACEVYEAADNFKTITKTFTDATTTVTDEFGVETALVPTSTRIITLAGDTQFSSFVAMSAEAMVTLVYQKSDIEAATSTGAEAAATSSNAAGRLNVAHPAFDGLGMIVGVCISAMALGAAIMLQ